MGAREEREENRRNEMEVWEIGFYILFVVCRISNTWRLDDHMIGRL